jgi:ferredoxin-NADP reductase
VRPFTFTSLPEDDHLELMIKIYRNINGVTKQLETINAGDELIIHEVFGVIEFKEKGIFIAAGTGITPFLSIFRNLYRLRQIHGNLLIFSNRTSDDVMMDEELQQMLGENYIKTFTRENVIGFIDRRIDRNFLIQNIDDFEQHFYLCGPESFVRDLNKLLQSLGASPEFIIFEP